MRQRPQQNGQGKGQGQPGGRGLNRNQKPCPKGGKGRGQGSGQGRGKNRNTNGRTYMKTLIIVFLSILFITPVQANDWTSKDTAYQAAFLTLHAADYLQTKEIIRNPKFYERNLYLGRNPSHNRVDIYFAGTAIVHTGITYLLPENYYIWGHNIYPRRAWQCVFIGLEVGCVVHNLNAGVRIRF